jgi:hypothetical protein
MSNDLQAQLKNMDRSALEGKRKLAVNLNNFSKYLHYNYDEQRGISFNSACL